LTEEKFIVKASSGPRYVVGCRRGVDREALKTRETSSTTKSVALGNRFGSCAR